VQTTVALAVGPAATAAAAAAAAAKAPFASSLEDCKLG